MVMSRCGRELRPLHDRLVDAPRPHLHRLHARPVRGFLRRRVGDRCHVSRSHALDHLAYEWLSLLWDRLWEPVDHRALAPLSRLKRPRRARCVRQDLLEPMGDLPHHQRLLRPERLCLAE